LDHPKSDKIDVDEIKEACEGLINPKKIDEGLKNLADLGVIDEKTNPETGKKEYGLADDKPKLLPLFKDLLKDKEFLID
jgi:DNA-binding HxlR family transcriptional regulator